MIRRLPAAGQQQDAGAKIAAEQQFVCAVLRALAAGLTERLGESRLVRCHVWLDDWMVFPRRTVGIDLADRYLMQKVGEAVGVGGIGTGSPDVSNRPRSEEHTSELQSLMRISYAVFCLKKKR